MQLQNSGAETIEALNDGLDDNEKMNSNEFKEESKDTNSHLAYFILLYPLENHEIEKVDFTRLRLRSGTSIVYTNNLLGSHGFTG